MKNILNFKSKTQLEREQNLESFIEESKASVPSNVMFDYDSPYWKGIGNFTVFNANSRQRNTAQLLHHTIMTFAKAYVISGDSNKSQNSRKFKALRAMNNACLELYGEFDVTRICMATFEKAVSIGKSIGSEGHAYQTGLGLKELHTLLTKKGIIEKFIWKNPCPKPAFQSTSEQADQQRQEKMPDENALLALAEIFSNDAQLLSERDILVSSTIALLMSAPGRGSEPFYLKADCLTQETMQADRAIDLGLDQGQLELLIQRNGSNGSYSLTTLIVEQEQLLQDSSEAQFFGEIPITLIGMKWFSGKGYLHATKWLPISMYDVVFESVSRLLTLSSRARSFAQNLEDYPDKFPQHELCPQVPEDQPLTMDEAALALGLDLSIYEDDRRQMRTSRNQILRKHGIARKDFSVTLSDLNKIVRSKLPEGFPYIPFENGQGKVKVKWSESLYANFKNAFHSNKSTIYTELHIPTINTLNEDLAPSNKKNKNGEIPKGAKSIFQRWGFGDLVLTTHQIRHMLDTIAAVNGMDEQLRAKWAMRSDPTHNIYYDHTTPEEYGADFIEAVEQERTDCALSLSTVSNLVPAQIAKPRTIQELNTKAMLTAHTTEFGMCTHSYISEPCVKFRDCINCSELVCIKGDDDKCERIRARLKTERRLLTKDKKAVDDGVSGAERWYERRKQTVKRCEDLVSILDDPTIENGALIKLPSEDDVSLLDRAMDKKNKKRLPKIENFKRLNSLNNEPVQAAISEHNLFGSNDFFDAIQGMEEDI